MQIFTRHDRLGAGRVAVEAQADGEDGHQVSFDFGSQRELVKLYRTEAAALAEKSSLVGRAVAAGKAADAARAEAARAEAARAEAVSETARANAHRAETEAKLDATEKQLARAQAEVHSLLASSEEQMTLVRAGEESRLATVKAHLSQVRALPY